MVQEPLPNESYHFTEVHADDKSHADVDTESKKDSIAVAVVSATPDDVDSTVQTAAQLRTERIRFVTLLFSWVDCVHFPSIVPTHYRCHPIGSS